MCGRRVRRFVVFALIGAAVAAVVRALRGEPAPQFANHPSVTGGPAPAPASTPEPASAPTTEADAAPAGEPELAALATPEPEVAAAEGASGTDPGAKAWVEPVDGACPDGYPIKVKLASGIYHQPGGLAYERTKPDRCYASAADADADGFRPAKR